MPNVRAAAAALLTAVALAGALGACNDDGGSDEAFCKQATALKGDNPATVFDTYDPANPEAAEAELERAAGQLRDLADSAPDAVRDQTSGMARLAERLVDALADDDPAAGFAELGDLSADFREFEEASRVVNEYSVATCGVTLDPGPTAPGA